MRKLLVFALMLTLVGSAMAIDLGTDSPAKPASNAPQNVPNPALQGGDTILDAVMVTLPANESGMTTGYNDDYDEECPYAGSLSPDVVYSFVATGDMTVEVDLFGSTYDTKVYVYDENLALIACNDDFYPDFVSKIENMPVMNGVMYFVVIDGYGSDFGNYVMAINEFVPPPPCIIECPDGAELEGEPALENDYVDNWNGGCNTPGTEPFQQITSPVFCGVSGFYLASGGNSRDTDWFEIVIPAEGVLEVTGDAEELAWMFELGPQDCATTGVIQQSGIGPCLEGSMTIVGAPGSIVWYWVGPQEFASPDGSDVFEFDYVLVSNLGPIATEDHSWTGVKALFN
jgi:hypothetical protein